MVTRFFLTESSTSRGALYPGQELFPSQKSPTKRIQSRKDEAPNGIAVVAGEENMLSGFFMVYGSIPQVESSQKNALTNGPPGFPQLFPELPPQEQMMNMLYVSHSDDAERHASIFLVKQSLADQGKLHVATLTRLTSDLDKGKGHVFSYTKNNSVEKLSKIPRAAQSLPIQTQFHSEDEKLDSAFSAMVGCSDSAVSTSFQVGTSLDPPACDRRVGKMSRCRPPSWKIKAQAVKAAQFNSNPDLVRHP
ncbi:hypothetical protein HID58_014659 [Brassica napus]|uniref:Uncharacterized protein n=1 Tax=Brassica napus TaxID=3708 RepID=A0ABQ8DHR6_BRANA|nr:hypothetical protein HID58_014659 [Brassica napus]